MSGEDVMESFNNAWIAMCRQYQKKSEEELRNALNMLGRIITEVECAIKDSEKKDSITIAEWMAMLCEGLDE